MIKDKNTLAQNTSKGTLVRGPSIILIEPQLGQNIGMSARAMMNCGLYDLRLVNPRDGWPNLDAVAASAEANSVIENTKIYKNTADAIADLRLVFAASARIRDMTKRIINPTQAIQELSEFSQPSCNVGVMFGCESKGLKNDDVALSDALLCIPLNPSFKSLNLAQAVYTVGYEWFKSAGADNKTYETTCNTRLPASKRSLLLLFEHLESELEKTGFLRVAEKQPSMKINLRNMLTRARLTEQEVQTFRGIIRSLSACKNISDTN